MEGGDFLGPFLDTKKLYVLFLRALASCVTFETRGERGVRDREEWSGKINKL